MGPRWASPMRLLSLLAPLAATSAVPLCACGLKVTDTDAVLPGIDSRHALRASTVTVAGVSVTALTFKNPGGFEFDTVVVSRADNLHVSSDGSAESTWFDGYEWRILSNTACPGWSRHAGWHFRRTHSMASDSPRPAPSSPGVTGTSIVSPSLHPLASEPAQPTEFFLLIVDRLGPCEDARPSRPRGSAMGDVNARNITASRAVM